MRNICFIIVVFACATLLNNVCCLIESSDAQLANKQIERKNLKSDDTFAKLSSDYLNDYFALLKKVSA